MLRPDEQVSAMYEGADWEDQVARFPTVTPSSADDPLRPRELIVGITAGEASKAYPLAVLKTRSPVLDTLGGVPILILVGDDKKSVRAFDARVDGRQLEFFAKTGVSPLRLVDDATG